MPFYIWQDTRVSAHWNYSFDTHHWYWGHVSCFSPSWIPSGYTVRFWWLHGWRHSLFIKVSGNIFLSARKNFHHFSKIKIFASLVYFRTLVSLFFFFSNYIHLLYLLYNRNFIFTFIFCIGFPWNLYELFHYIFQNNSRKKLVSFMPF